VRTGSLRGGVLAVAIVASVSGCTGSGSDPDASRTGPSTAQSSASPHQTGRHDDLPGIAPTEADLVGQWLAVTLHNGPAPSTKPPIGTLRDLLTLSFGQPDGHLWWGGLDWCNPSAGRVRLGADGRFSTFKDAVTARGCVSRSYQPPDVTVPSVVVDAAFIRLDGDTLTLYGDDGTPLGTFDRVLGSAQSASILTPPKPVTMDAARRMASAQEFRPYSGPQPPPLQKQSTRRAARTPTALACGTSAS
jgi:hypothetical protein